MNLDTTVSYKAERICCSIHPCECDLTKSRYRGAQSFGPEQVDGFRSTVSTLPSPCTIAVSLGPERLMTLH